MARLGILPNLFSTAPKLAEELWLFARSAYLDNPLPSLFKERLFVYLSRLCPARYCLVRHVGFLLGHGYPAGDASAQPHTVAQVIGLLSLPLPNAARLRAGLARLAAHAGPAPLPAPETAAETDLLDALAVLFVEPQDAAPVSQAVRHAVGEATFERLLALLAFVRAVHYCLSTYPQLAFEPDMVAVLAQHPALAQLLLGPTQAERQQAADTLRRTLARLHPSPPGAQRPRGRGRRWPGPASGGDARFEAATNLGADLRWRNAPGGTTTWCNQRWLAYTGQAPAEALNYGWLSVIHPDDRPGSLHQFQLAVDEGRPVQFAHRIRSATGEYRWFLVQTQPVYTPQGELAEWVGAATDIHVRKLAELAPAGGPVPPAGAGAAPIALSVFRALRGASGQVEDFEILILNANTHQAVGGSAHVGKRYSAVFPHAVPSGVLEQFRAVATTGVPADFERWYEGEGQHRWLRYTAVRHDDLLVVHTEDITPRRPAAPGLPPHLLAQAEQLAEMGTWDYDVATGALRWSAGMYRLFGLAPGAPVVPEVYCDFAVADDRALARHLVHHLRQGAAGFEHTLRIEVGGQLKTLHLKAAALPDEGGWPWLMLGVALDGSRVQRLEQENRRLRRGQQQERRLAVLAAQEEERRRISESLHNGLGQILYATKLQLDQLANAPALTAAPALATARHEADRLLSEAIRQARTLSHEFTPGIVAELGLEAALREICRTLHGPQLCWQCLVHLDEDYPVPLPLQVAAYRLAQEITQNVHKHARATHASLEVETLPGWLVLRAEDNGQGFDPAAPTAGIGLKTLRSRVELLGGTMHLASAPGQGTQLQLCIPLHLPLPLQ